MVVFKIILWSLSWLLSNDFLLFTAVVPLLAHYTYDLHMTMTPQLRSTSW